MDSQEGHKGYLDNITQEIMRTLSSLKYGCVQITVHNSQVVQIEKTEKTRFSADRKL